jgi:hypothetical protein
MMRQVLYEMSREHAAKVQLQKEVQAVSETLYSDQTLFVSAWADYDRDDVVTLWVATCLSAGVNPNHKAARSKDFAERMVAIGSAADDCIKKLDEVLRRYKNVLANAEKPDSKLDTIDKQRTKIELSAFRKWVEAEKNWELPKGFPGAPALLAGPEQPNVATPSPAPEHQAAPVRAVGSSGEDSLEFIRLATAVARIADCVQLDPHLDDSATAIGYISRATADKFWKENNPKIEWARSFSVAAYILNKALHDSNTPPQWMELDEQKRFAVKNDAVKQEGIELLTHATGWGNREQGNCSIHFFNAITQGEDELAMPIARGLNDGLAPDGKMLRFLNIGFDRAELVAFLDKNQIDHNLTPSPAPVPQAPPVVADSAPGGVESATGKRWTPERLAELKACREKYNTKEAARQYGISTALVRKLLPSEKPQPKGYSAFTHHIK